MKTITVTTNGQLQAAIAELETVGGGTIELKNTGETYNLTGHNLGTEDGVITITSADINDQAVMDGVRLTNATNLSFEHLNINSEGVSRSSWIKDFMVESSKNISVSNSTFTSRADGTFMESGAGVARGEDMGFVRDTDGFTFENNVVSNYFNGLALVESNDLNVTGNEFAYIQGDGIRGGGMQDAVFKDNWFHDWYGSAKSINHDDMFQIWGTNMEQLSKNILIEGNFFDSGGGTATQTILIKNEHWKSEDDNYSNIVVNNNVIYNGHTHGVTIYDTVGVEVTNNTILYDSQASTPTGNVSNPPSIRVGNPEDAVVTGNIANKIYVDGKAETNDNIWIDYTSPLDDNYFDKHIINIDSGGRVDLRDLELRPDSPWAGNFGANASQNSAPTDGSITAVMTHSEVPGEYGTYLLDATLSQGSDGYLSKDGTTFEWHFADGTVVEGSAVEVEFDSIGLNEVRLVIKTADGAQDSITREINVENAVIRDIDFNAGSDTTGLSFEDYSEANFVEGLNGGGGFLLDGDSEAVLNKKISDLYELDQFTIEVALQKLDADGAGKLLDFHRSMSMSITDDGSIRFGMNTSDGNFAVESGALEISDTDWHKISVVYNSHFEELSLWMDGNKLGSSHATGETIPFESWGPRLGNMDFKGDSIKAVVDEFAFHKEALDDVSVQQDHIRALSLEEIDLDIVYGSEDGALGIPGNVYRSVEGADTFEIITQPTPAEPTEEEVVVEEIRDGMTAEQDQGEVTPEPEAEETPVEDAQETPEPEVEEAPVEDAQETPEPEVEETPVEDAQETPEPEAEETPVEDAQETPEPEVEETPVEDAQETPEPEAEEAPVEEPDPFTTLWEREDPDDPDSHYVPVSVQTSQIDMMLAQNPHMVINVEDIPILSPDLQDADLLDVDTGYDPYGVDYYVF